ncbi:Nitrate transporter [Chondrus crispus]|uniref:Nitrate transporter n=1 Tax=Chondrus crispus TaxID=2769 RepID=R7QFV5_CHOCR|nr:Nitrate transporter [Chondrus crispus]CDF36336.1 Nitrate transporter [Chondrus crispus]|eukprot:XP_005716155.1 Nitrate transporter [Chondrus crispus]
MTTPKDANPDTNAQPAPAEPTHTFALPVDENNKATSIKLWSVKRPHMRAFHFAWSSFFLAFFGWFALAPLQKGIRDSPRTPWLNGDNFKAQNIISVAGTLLMRLAVGPFCDRFGPRLAQSILLGVFSLPVFLVGTSQSYAQWTTARFFIGFIGATFVVTQFWTSLMFSGNIVGTANATSAGWGNLGGGVTNALMPQIFKGIRRSIGFEPSGLVDSDGKEVKSDSQLDAENKAWRYSQIIPGGALIIIALSLFFLSDDLPEGNYADLHKAGTKEKTNPFVAMGRAARNWRVWILFLLYAGCFGVELLMNQNLATYFQEQFDVEAGLAGLLAGLFGLMNLFARSLGGIFSDVMAKKFGLRGRLWAFFSVQLIEGLLFVGFSRLRGNVGVAVPVLVLFSLFVQMAEGATFGIVPFVDPPATGAVSGIVGAGGNFGAVTGGFLIEKGAEGTARGFMILGFIVIGTAMLIPLLWWPQYGSMFLKPSVETKVIDDDSAEAEVEQTKA